MCDRNDRNERNIGCPRRFEPMDRKCYNCPSDHQVFKHQHIIKHRHDIINEYDVVHEHDYFYRDVVKVRDVVKHHDHEPYNPRYCEDDNCRENMNNDCGCQN